VTHPQLHAWLLHTPSGLKQVRPELHCVASLHFAPSAPVLGAAQVPFTQVLGFWHTVDAPHVQPVQL
jgi:hypothetical protein